MAAGGTHSVALTTQGVPYSWGYSHYNALGRELQNEEQDTNEMGQ
jgi:alpha-tubulin suppressor-like RCC1 family protein